MRLKSYNIVAEMPELTVVAAYQPDTVRSITYQSEYELEKEFVSQLVSQGYEKLNIKSESDLINNLRSKLEKLNDVIFSDKEWELFFRNNLASENEGIKEKTRKIQKDYIQILRRDDNTTKNIYLIDKKNIHNNSVQVLNQYVECGGKHDTRYVLQFW